MDILISATRRVLMKEATNGGNFQYAVIISVSHEWVPLDIISMYGSLSSNQITVRRIGARDDLESALAAEQVVFPQVETLDDVGMLIAGTEDQPLHHDVARTFSGWVSNKAKHNAQEEDPVAGWEVGRLEFNEAMASPYAPSSIIVGMGEESFLGVQKDQIREVAPGKCTVVGGTGETFEVVRETEHLVVLRTKRGFMLAGDFPHAGVRNVSKQSPENDLVDLLNERISSILADESFLTSRDQLAAVIDVLCEFPGLNKLCRFHCSTRLLEGKMKSPFNTVGFTDCLPNPPAEDSHLSTSLQTLESANVQIRKNKATDVIVEGLPMKWFSGCVPLAFSEDKHWLSERHVYFRSNFLEAFTATESDIEEQGRKSIALGQVGIRCIHCRERPPRERGQRAASFPTLVSAIYLSVQKMIRLHVECCPAVPSTIRKKIETLKKSISARKGGQEQYYIDSAKRLGLVDTPQGIRFGRDPYGLVPALESASVSNVGDKTVGDCSEKEKVGKEDDVAPEAALNTPDVAPEDLYPLVLPEDKELISDLLYLTLEQVQPCLLIEADRVGSYKKREVGCRGLACKHCGGKAGCGR
jgi:hypothetical protein